MRVLKVFIVPFGENAVSGWLCAIVNIFLLSLGQGLCFFLRKWRLGFAICVFSGIGLLYLEGHIVFIDFVTYARRR